MCIRDSINPDLGESRMKEVILEMTKTLEGRKFAEAQYENEMNPDWKAEDQFSDERDDEFDVEALPDDVHDTKAPARGKVSARARKTLQGKVDKHNEKHGDNPSKRATLRMLEAVFRRGVGAYYTNPQSVRPNVSGPDQWAFARVNAFLFALRTGRFQGGKFDRDLLPKGHPLSTKE